MLVLSRKKDELICIGHDITVMVIEVKGGKCRLGIVAPKDMKVLRGELKNESNESDA
jgi:carbon storage regulator CsrA